MEKPKETLRPYEVVLLMHPDSTLEEQKELFRKNKTIIDSFKGNVLSLETWGKRNIGNPIGKCKKAIFFHSMFEALPAVISELERTMRINDKVFRFVHTSLDVRIPLNKHYEFFKKGLQESANREKEKEAKAQLKRAQASSGYSGGGDKY